MVFSIAFVVKENGPKTKSAYPFQFIQEHDTLGVNLAVDNILQNWYNLKDVTMNGAVLWRGPREKSRQFMQMIVPEAFTEPGAVIVDCTAATSEFMFVMLSLSNDEMIINMLLH